MKKDYYLTCIYSNGAVSGPTRMPLVQSFPEAEKEKKKMEKLYPDCRFEIQVVDAFM